MFFQISPVRRVKKTVQKVPNKKESEEPTVLSLAPFTPNPKLFFEDVKVGEEATRDLVIKNPTNRDVELLLTHVPSSEEINVSFNWHRALVKSQEDVVLQVYWKPTVACACREIITLCDGKKIKKDVPIVFKSIDIKTIKKGTRKCKAPSFPSKKVKSPPPAERIQRPLKSPLKTKQTILPRIIETAPTNSNNLIFASDILPLRPLNCDLNDDFRRETYRFQIEVDDENKENVFDDSLEAKTPFENRLNQDLFTFSPCDAFQPTICSSEDKSRTTNLFATSAAADLSAKTYVLNRQNNISTENLTYTKEFILNNTSLQTIDFAQQNSLLCSSLNDDEKKRKSTDWNLKFRTTANQKRFQLNDPFLTGDFSEEWIVEQELHFQRWLNVILTPPNDLQANAEQEIDVVKMWRECKQKDVSIVAIKEPISNGLHSLVALRTMARDFFKRSELVVVIKKVVNAVESGKLSIRNDRDVHLDLGIQSVIMSLLLSYNPLWLRIGLETIYSTTIPLKNNSDLMGLNQFLLARFFRDPFLYNKHKTILSNRYAADIKKFILKKFLTLVYFLDQAKTQKLIKHDPCLFCKNAAIKTSKQMLIEFSKEAIHAIGDVTRFLKHFNYVVTYQQTFLDEFDYAIKNLGVDLRDGVRLTRIVEIILMKNDLKRNLRVPAISRLQKIHNVKIAFIALEQNGFQLNADIKPRDIVDGHREKTLSFLWQILYKFQTPFLIKSAETIQKWWRCLPVMIKRRIFIKEREKQRKAVEKISTWYKNQKLARELEKLVVVFHRIQLEIKRDRAAIKIQSFARMCLQKRKFQTIILQRNQAILKIQHFLRGVLARKRYLQLKSAAVKIEERYYARKLMQQQLIAFQTKKSAAISIQKWYRSILLMRQLKNHYQRILWATKIIQNQFRVKQQRKKYLQLIATVAVVKNRFKTKQIRKRFLQQKQATILIQREFRARKIRQNYLRLKQVTIKLQRIFRAKKSMEKQRSYFMNLKMSAIFIQRFYRARKQRLEFLKQRESAIKIQSYFRMFRERKRFERIKSSVVFIQKIAREFLLQRRKKAVAKIVWFLKGVILRKRFLQLKQSVRKIEEIYIGKKLMQQQILQYQHLKMIIIDLQIRCRLFLRKKQAVVKIQRWFRSVIETRKLRNDYKKLLWATNVIKTRFRAKLQMQSQRNDYLTLLKTIKFTQQQFKTKLIRKRFLQLKNTVIFLQRCFRAKKQRMEFKKLRNATVVLQKRFKATILMRKQRKDYLQLKKAVVFIQKLYRARNTRKKFLQLKRTTIKIQRNYRAKKQRKNYLELKNTVIYIQKRYRGVKFAKNQRQTFLTLKHNVVVIQRKFKALLQMRKERSDFLRLKHNVIVIQRKYRALKQMRVERKRFLQLKKSVLYVESVYFARCEWKRYQELKTAAIAIQKWYRSKCMMKQQKALLLCKLQTIYNLQTLARGFLARKTYGDLTNSQIRENLKRKREEERAVVKIQAFWRGYKTRKEHPQLTQIRKRSVVATLNAATSRTLGYLKVKALETLTNEQPSLGQIILALQDLDFITRRCKTTCEKLCDVLSEEVYITICGAGRSVPEMNASIVAASILINFCKYPPTTKKCWHPDYIDQILTVMQNCCDKESALFSHLCTLLWLFAHEMSRKRFIKSLPNVAVKLEKIGKLVLRKQNMVARARTKTVTFFERYRRLPLPSLKPDWGLDLRDAPRTFTNAVHGFDCLLRILDVK